MSKRHLRSIRESFAIQADWYSTPASPFTLRELGDWVLDLLPNGRAGTALDVAAGTGTLSRVVARSVTEVVALDATPEMLDEGRAITESQGVQNVRFEEGVAESIPYPAEQFDLVVSRLAVHHFQTPPTAIGEMARVCKERGVVGIVDMIAGESAAIADLQNKLERLRDPSHVRLLNPGELTELLRTQGLTDIRLSFGEQTKPLEEWLAATATPSRERHLITSAVRDELAGGLSTGLNPFVKSSDLHITQKLAFIKGTKLQAST